MSWVIYSYGITLHCSKHSTSFPLYLPPGVTFRLGVDSYNTNHKVADKKLGETADFETFTGEGPAERLD